MIVIIIPRFCCFVNNIFRVFQKEDFLDSASCLCYTFYNQNLATFFVFPLTLPNQSAIIARGYHDYQI